MKRNSMVVASLALVIGLLAVGATAAIGAAPPASEATPPASEGGHVELLSGSCSSGHVCVWTEPSYKGAKGESLCTGGAHSLSGFKLSVVNSCGNKAAWLRVNGVANECINAGFEYEITAKFNELWIGAEGSHC
jgi:hypothetical protein